MSGRSLDRMAAVREEPREAVRYLQGVARASKERGLKADCTVRDGPADEVIVGYALDVEADLIVTTTRGRGRLRRALLSSVSDAVVRSAPCPVMLVRVGDEARR